MRAHWLRFFVFLFFVGSGLTSAQVSPLNNPLKLLMQDRTNFSNSYTLLVQGNTDALRNFSASNFHFNYSAGDIASITCDLNVLSQLIKQQIVTRAELIRSQKHTMNDTMTVRNRILPVKQGAAPLAQTYDGTGVIVGIIDTGLDFTHPDFKDAQGNTRVQFIWDQTVPSSTPPSLFGYGTEWTAAQINASLCTHNDNAGYGHGTHVAGIAAGNGLANGTHQGCAPKADIIAVAMDFNNPGPNVADAVQYIFDKATQLGKPCVINASVGDYYGSHDGTDLEAKLIDAMVAGIPGRVVVASAGNAGPVKYHVKTQATAADTLFTWIKNNAPILRYWCYADTPKVKNLQMSVGANRNDYSNIGNIGFKNYNYALTGVKTDTLKNGSNRIGIIKSTASINSYGVYEFYAEITPDTANLFWRIETTGNGLHHAWNFDFVSSNLPTTTQFPQMTSYAMPDTFYTMVSGFQCSDEIITVANYVNSATYYDVNNTFHNTGGIPGKIAQSSSSGPTRDHRQKPEIAASGEMIFSALAPGIQTVLIANAPQVIAQGSMHVQGGGTSASSPVVAGLVALYLQKNPTADNRQVKSAITQCAYSDAFTGTTLPNYQWGYGKLDGKATMLCGENLLLVKSLPGSSRPEYMPNPFQDKVTLLLPGTTEAKLFVYSSDGKLLFDDSIHGERYVLCSEKLGDHVKGLLLVRIGSDAGNYTLKLMKN